MGEILTALSPCLKWLIMKRDKELPMATCVARWGAVVLGLIFGSGYVVHCYLEWFF